MLNLIDKKYLYIILAIFFIIPIIPSFAIQCIEPLKYGNFEPDVLTPISNPECKIMTLFVEIGQKKNESDVETHLQLHDKTQKIIPYSSFLVAVTNQDHQLMNEILHTNSGSLTIILKQNDTVKQWTLSGKNENDEKYVFDISPIKKAETYKVNISVFNVYDDRFLFKADERPQFNFTITSDESGHISQLTTELDQSTNNKSAGVNVSLTQSLSPLKQLQSGLKIEQIVCKEGYVLVIKSNDGNPACVKPETKIKLIERGWAKSVSR